MDDDLFKTTYKGENEELDEIQLLKVEAVAKMLDCSTRHVRRLADAGLMPRSLKLGTLVRWRKADIQDWIDAGCRPCRKPGR